MSRHFSEQQMFDICAEAFTLVAGKRKCTLPAVHQYDIYREVGYRDHSTEEIKQSLTDLGNALLASEKLFQDERYRKQVFSKNPNGAR